MTNIVSAEERLVSLGLQPLGMRLEKAAEFQGVTPEEFLRQVEQKKQPPPIRLGDVSVWHRHWLELAREGTAWKGLLEAVKRRQPEVTAGYVYVISADGLPFIKLGYAAALDNRLRALQIGNPFDLRVEASFHGNLEDEARLHLLLDKYRVRGEWFQKRKRVVRFIEGISASYKAPQPIAPILRELRVLR